MYKTSSHTTSNLTDNSVFQDNIYWLFHVWWTSHGELLALCCREKIIVSVIQHALLWTFSSTSVSFLK